MLSARKRRRNSSSADSTAAALSWFDALARHWLTLWRPIDAQPPNLREEMCGGHRRKPPSEENEEEPEESTTSASGESTVGNGQAFMLSSLKPANGKFVLGPPVETTPPVVVFTGPADHPDTVGADGKRHPERRKKAVAKTEGGERESAEKPDKDREAGKAGQGTAKPAKTGQSRK